MQEERSIMTGGNQVGGEVTVGVDMGGQLWAVTVRDRQDGRESYHAFRDKDGVRKQERLYALLRHLLASGLKVHVIYEAGRYGFAPARSVIGLGASVTVLPVSKLEVVSYGKRVKTDRRDSRFLANLRPWDGLPSVYIPTLEEESRRCGERERRRLQVCVHRLNSQMQAIVERSPVPTPPRHMPAEAWEKWLKAQAKAGELAKLPPFDVQRLRDMAAELALAEPRLLAWETRLAAAVKSERAQAAKCGVVLQMDKLELFTGIGDELSRQISWEVGDFGRFRNARAFAAYFGLAPCPFSSGNMNHEQGIGKSGREGLRKAAVEMAWLWVRWQPDSALTKKWKPRLDQKGRIRRTAIIALARQLLVALWRFVVRDEPVEGAVANGRLAAKG